MVVASAGNDGRHRGRSHGSRRHRLARQLAVRVDGRRLEHPGHRRPVRRYGGNATAPAARRTTISRSSPMWPRRATSIVSLEADDAYLGDDHPALHRAGSARQRLHAAERHEHGRADRQRRGGACCCRDASFGPAQIKLALQTGATFMRDGGLMGGGAGSVTSGRRGRLPRSLGADEPSRPRTLERRGVLGRGHVLAPALQRHGLACSRCSICCARWLNPARPQIGRSEPGRSDESSGADAGRIRCSGATSRTGRPANQIIWGSDDLRHARAADRLGSIARRRTTS